MSTSPILLQYQQSWLADASPVKVYSKSRRVGISWAEAADDALYSASVEGDDTWYIGYNQDMAREFIGDAAFWARHYQLAASGMEETVFENERLESNPHLPDQQGHREDSRQGPHGRPISTTDRCREFVAQ